VNHPDSRKSYRLDIGRTHVISNWSISTELAVQETLKRGGLLDRHGQAYGRGAVVITIGRDGCDRDNVASRLLGGGVTVDAKAKALSGLGLAIIHVLFLLFLKQNRKVPCDSYNNNVEPFDVQAIIDFIRPQS